MAVFGVKRRCGKHGLAWVSWPSATFASSHLFRRTKKSWKHLRKTILGSITEGVSCFHSTANVSMLTYVAYKMFGRNIIWKTKRKWLHSVHFLQTRPQGGTRGIKKVFKKRGGDLSNSGWGFSVRTKMTESRKLWNSPHSFPYLDIVSRKSFLISVRQREREREHNHINSCVSTGVSWCWHEATANCLTGWSISNFTVLPVYVCVHVSVC